MALKIEHPPLVGDDTKQVELHPRKLHDFFGWDQPWSHGLEEMEPRKISWAARLDLPGERWIE